MKHINKSTKNISEVIPKTDSSSEWLQAIQNAEDQLTELNRRSASLRGAIQIFKKKLASGEPFPATEDEKSFVGQDD